MTDREERHSQIAEDIMSELKSQGTFDTYRKRCLEDLEDKELYKELRNRVVDYVDQFLSKTTWDPNMNKAKLREELRRTISSQAFFNGGVESLSRELVSQPDIEGQFYPDITKVTYRHMGIEYEQPETSLEKFEPDEEAQKNEVPPNDGSELKEETIDVDEAADLSVVYLDDTMQAETDDGAEEEGGVMNMELESDEEVDTPIPEQNTPDRSSKLLQSANNDSNTIPSIVNVNTDVQLVNDLSTSAHNCALDSVVFVVNDITCSATIDTTVVDDDGSSSKLEETTESEPSPESVAGNSREEGDSSSAVKKKPARQSKKRRLTSAERLLAENVDRPPSTGSEDSTNTRQSRSTRQKKTRELNPDYVYY